MQLLAVPPGVHASKCSAFRSKFQSSRFGAFHADGTAHLPTKHRPPSPPSIPRLPPQPAVLPRLPAAACLLAVAACSFAAQLLLSRGFQLETATKASAANFTQVLCEWGLGFWDGFWQTGMGTGLSEGTEE